MVAVIMFGNDPCVCEGRSYYNARVVESLNYLGISSYSMKESGIRVVEVCSHVIG